MAANSPLLKRPKSKSAPALFRIFSKDKKKEDLTRELFTTLSEYIDDFETDPTKRAKVVALVNAYYRDLRRIISNDKPYELHLNDFKIVVDFLVEEFLNDPHKASVLMGMVSYVDILNSTSINGGFWRGNQTMSRYWLNARFQIAAQHVNIIKDMTTVFKVAFCDDQAKNKCIELLVKASPKKSDKEKLQEGLVNAIRTTIFSGSNNVSDDECVDLSIIAHSIVLGDVVAESKEEVVARVKEVVPEATVKPKKWAIVSDIFAAVVKAFTEWLFEAKQPEKSVMASVAESPKMTKKSVQPETGSRHNDAKSKQPPLMKVEQPISMTPQPIRRNHNVLSNSKCNFYEEHSRNNTRKEKEEVWETPQPLGLLTDEHGSPLISRFG